MTIVTHQDPVVHSMGKTQRIMLRAIEWYQRQREGALSPCRFFPTCSSYAHDAIVQYGPWRGCWMAARRLGRCRPFGPSGYDPVPNTDGCCDQLHHRPHEKG